MGIPKKSGSPNPVLGTSLSPISITLLKTSKIRFMDRNSATTVPQKYVTYKPPRIVKTSKRWYVEYWYRVPVEFRDKYKKEYARFRVFEDINRYKTNEYANLLRDNIERALQEGYSPFEKEVSLLTAEPCEWNLNYGLERYMDYCKEKGLRDKTLQSYSIIVNFLKDYFYRDNKIFRPITEYTKKDILAFLNHGKKLHSWEPTTYNNYLGYLAIIFNWFVKQEQLTRSPVVGIETKKAPVTRHKYYDDETAAKLKDAISRSNPYLYSFIEFIYYTAIRPKSEARLLQVKHLLFDRSLIHIPGDVAKNKEGDFVPMPDELKERLSHLRGLPPDTYIWGVTGPAKKPASQNHFASLYKPYKDKFGLGKEHTIYSFKHTRCIDLVKAGANAYDIMRLFRHSSLEQTQIYMKDLGLTDFSEVLRKGKKF